MVDAYDAMASERPYRAAMPEDEVREELRRCAGSQLDPEIVEVFLALDREHLAVVRRMASEAEDRGRCALTAR